MQIPSPCIGLCRIDPGSGWCLGCARTGDEIARWGTSPDLRERAWAELPARRARLGLALHRLAWTASDLRAFVEETLKPGRGTWVSGPYGAVAEFSISEGEAVERRSDSTTLSACTARGATAHFLPKMIRAGRDLPANLELPSVYVPTFVHYPARKAGLGTRVKRTGSWPALCRPSTPIQGSDRRDWPHPSPILSQSDGLRGVVGRHKAGHDDFDKAPSFVDERPLT